MSDGRTVWRAKDAAWWRREWIVELGEEFGAAGPAVIDWLECEAKAQNGGGHVKAGLKTVGRGCFVDAVTVGHVVSRSVTLGLLADYMERDGRFECRIYWWQGDQQRAMAAGRKATQRNREADETGESASTVTLGHAESRSVTKCPPTVQDNTEQIEQLKSSSPPDPVVVELCERLGARVRANDPKFDVAKVRSERWLTDMRRLLADRGGDRVEVERVIDWCQSDGFERSNVLSPAKLRSRFTALLLKAVPSAGGERQERQARRLAALERLQVEGAT